MIAFGWVTNMLQRGMASWKRMLEVLDTEPAIADANRGGRMPASRTSERASRVRHPRTPIADRAIRGEIEFRDLVFAYGDASS